MSIPSSSLGECLCCLTIYVGKSLQTLGQISAAPQECWLSVGCYKKSRECFACILFPLLLGSNNCKTSSCVPSMSAISIPDSSGVTASIISSNCKEHVKWIKTVFLAEQVVVHCSDDDEGRVLHTALTINGGRLYMSDYMKEFHQTSSDVSAHPPTGFFLQLDVPDVQGLFHLASGKGAVEVVRPEGHPEGIQFGCFKDPFGQVWGLVQVEEGKGTPGVVPCLVLGKQKCEDHVQWLVSVFEAEITSRCTRKESGSTGHCVLAINGSRVNVVGETPPSLDFLSAPSSTHLLCHLELDDPYPLWKKALENGSTVKLALEVQFWGSVYGSLVDKMGVEWSFSKKTSKEEKAPAEGIFAYVVSPNCEEHIEWIQHVFEGEIKTLFRHMTSRKVVHCDLSFRVGRLMICDASCGPNQANGASQKTGKEGVAGGGASSVVVHVHCSDPDPLWKRAMATGAVQVEELKKQYWGGYFGCLKDPYGTTWGLLKI